MLEIEQTNALIREAKGGCERAKEKLLQENTNLMKSIVRRYLGKGVEYDDLFQLASLGLLKAIAGFDESFGVRFSTYAVPMIAGEIKRFMRDDGAIKVSRAIKGKAKEINRYIEDYTAKEGKSPDIEHLAQVFQMPKSEIIFTIGSSRMPLSLYAQSDYKDDKSRELVESIPIDDSQEDVIERLQLKFAIQKLEEREKKIIILRYFRDLTQSEVAKVLGVSQVQVSRIESKIMQSFRQELY